MKAKGKYKQPARHAAASHTMAGFMASVLLLSGCSLFGENKPTEAKITSPAPNSTINVGEQVQIEGLVTGDGITKVDIVIDNTTYASLSAPDQSQGVPNFPIGGADSPVPWTPLAAGAHALQLIVYGAPDNALKAKSEPVLITAQASESVALPTEAPAQPTADLELQPTLAPPGTGASNATAAPGSTAPAGAGSGTTAGAPSMTVMNDFVNVRKGPGVGYEKVGQLNKGETAPVKGKSSDGGWLQVSFPSAPGGVGWVKLKDESDTLVQANDAANNVPVVAAPALPAAPVVSNPVPAQPVAPAVPVAPSNPVIIPIGPAATAAPPAVAPPAATGPLLGSRNVLKVNTNPVASGGTLYATWSIPSFRDGEFDKGDGAGFKGPIAGSMTVDVPGITGARTLVLRWRDSGGQQLEDTIVVQGGISGGAPVAPPAQTGSLTGSRNVLRINSNPVNSGATVYATWSIPNFRDGELDKGDGTGFKGPIAGAMTVDIPNVTSSRNVTLRWRDTSGQQLEDMLVLQVAGSVVAATSVVRSTCSSTDPNWRGGTAAYPFCAARDLSWTDGGKEVRSFTQGQDVTLTANWDVYGIGGINFIVEPSGQVCGPAGPSTINRATIGTGQESFNVKDLGYGGYKVFLRVKRNDGVEVAYNEKFLCIGNSTGNSPTATPGPAPSATSTNPPAANTPIPDPNSGNATSTPAPDNPEPTPDGQPTLIP